MAKYHKYKTSKHGEHHSYRITKSGNIDQRHFTQSDPTANKHWGCIILSMSVILGIVGALKLLSLWLTG